jgi:hypothetical protein
MLSYGSQVKLKFEGSAFQRKEKSNNGMHPTGNSMDVIRQLECLFQSFPAGDAGRSVAFCGMKAATHFKDEDYQTRE